jgi:hypothetical protein
VRGERLGNERHNRYSVTRKILHVRALAGEHAKFCTFVWKLTFTQSLQKGIDMQRVYKNESGRLIGESHPGAKLTDVEVDLVFELRAAGLSLQCIADKMDVTKGCIWKILTGERRGQSIAAVSIKRR